MKPARLASPSPGSDGTKLRPIDRDSGSFVVHISPLNFFAAMFPHTFHQSRSHAYSTSANGASWNELLTTITRGATA